MQLRKVEQADVDNPQKKKEGKGQKNGVFGIITLIAYPTQFLLHRSHRSLIEYLLNR